MVWDTAGFSYDRKEGFSLLVPDYSNCSIELHFDYMNKGGRRRVSGGGRGEIRRGAGGGRDRDESTQSEGYKLLYKHFCQE